MQTSDNGIAFLERHEGVVLKAYRCPAGYWTIGAGLTKDSGVVTPQPGMRITRAEANRLLGLALRRNYEPSVARVMPDANQHEFDGGVSFHFNTGAIDKASWVHAWAKENWGEAERRIKLWRKGGGKVLPGLERRRSEEFDLIAYGFYEKPVEPQVSLQVTLARFVVPVTPEEMIAIRAEFERLGYAPGVRAQGVSTFAVTRFQADHDLTVDGIIGRATLSTLQRRIDARSSTAATATTTVAGTAGVGAGGAMDAVPVEQAAAVGGVIIAAGLVFALWLAWSYRDVAAAKVAGVLPRIAKLLRGI